MLERPLIIARKEIRDHLRDHRSLVSSVFYALMGPLVVGMVSLAMSGGKAVEVLVSMMSVFALVAGFVGGMNVAMDSIAGERERRSLLPLILNPILRRDIVAGKWLAICVFSATGLALNLAGFAMLAPAARPILLSVAMVVAPLTLLASALELLISTWCRNLKEAHTYLSLIAFLPMGAGMFLVFFPQAAAGWYLVPIAGHQLIIGAIAKGATISPVLLPALTIVTLASTGAILATAARLLEHDEIVYGG